MNKFILVGNPNTGKTTLFNSLTNSNEKASNWHGVTVGVKSKIINKEKDSIEFVDIPGLYSLNGEMGEEKIACEYLKENFKETILNICDINNLQRNLLLTVQLINAGYNVVVILNMIDEKKNIDTRLLSRLLNVDVVCVDARNKKTLNKLLLNKIIKNEASIKNAKIIKNKLNYTNIINNIDKYCDFAKINRYKTTDKIDRIILNKATFLIFFLLVLFSVFYITFGPIGVGISSIFDMFFNTIFDKMRKVINCINISYIIKLFINDGIFVGVSSVLSFIPQIVLLSMFINFLEESGFMSRIAFMFDGLLKRIGLNGKSLFGIMMGYGCTTSAVMATRNIEDVKLRKRTVLILPFVSCSAKLPVYLVLCSLFFSKYKYIFVFGLYVFGIVLALIFSVIYSKFLPNDKNTFLIEMPKYRVPNFKKILKDAYFLVIDFLIKIGTIIVIFSSIVWFLRNFDTSFIFLNGTNFEFSILYFIANKISFIFSFIGLNNPGIVASLILGIFAKELIVVGFTMINGVEAGLSSLSFSLIDSNSNCSFTLISSIVFLIFVLIYSPCISSLISVKNEIGFKFSLFMFIGQFFIAYFISFVIYQLLSNYKFVYIFIFVLILDICLLSVLKFRSRNKKDCRGNCYACKRV